MTNVQRLLLASSAIFAAGCGRAAAMDDGMKEDLQAASAATMELAPVAGGQKVVSAIEQTPRPETAQRAPHGPSQAETESHTPNPQRQDCSQQVADGPAAQKPLPASSVRPAPPGGYKSMGEVLRKAPFPINPLHGTGK